MEDMMVFELLAERCWLAREEDIQVKSTFQQFLMMMKFRSEDVRTPLIPLPALRTGYLMTRTLRTR